MREIMGVLWGEMGDCGGLGVEWGEKGGSGGGE